MTRKIIGISGGMGDFVGTFRNGVSNDYFNSVIIVDGSPLMIPLSQAKEAIEDVVCLCDGVILTGGVDINPRRYHQDIMPCCGEISDDRDEYEYLLIEACINHHKPILGICRGIQILNVYFGGTLCQDVYQNKQAIKHGQSGSRGKGCHEIDIEKDSFLYHLWGEKAFVNSYHHQAVDELGEGFKAVAHAHDGVVEAIEHDTYPIYGVQFHPEIMSSTDEDMKALFDWFVNGK